MPDTADRPRRRWSRRKQARPGEIVAAALDLFAERGFAATRLDDVAARAGVSKGTLYLYFESKEELFKAVVRESIVPNIARVEALLTQFEGPTPDLIRTMVETIGMVVTTTKIGALPKLVIAEAGNFPDIARFYLEEVIHRGLAVLEAVLKRGIERGEFRPFDVRLSVRAVIAPVIVLAIWKNSFERFEAEPIDAHAFLTNHIDILMRGIAAPVSATHAKRGA